MYVFILFIYLLMKKTLLEYLMKWFVGESQARNRYTLYASTARKEWYLQIAEIFLQTADQEKEHAEWFWKMMEIVKQDIGEEIDEIEISTPAFVKKWTTLENLQYAIDGEHHEYDVLYPEFAQLAQELWYPQIATRIRAIMKSEMHHEERYLKLRDQLQANTLRNKLEDVERTCTKCGYVHKGKKPPAKCPSCDHEANYYIVKCEQY